MHTNQESLNVPFFVNFLFCSIITNYHLLRFVAIVDKKDLHWFSSKFAYPGVSSLPYVVIVKVLLLLDCTVGNPLCLFVTPPKLV